MPSALDEAFREYVHDNQDRFVHDIAAARGAAERICQEAGPGGVRRAGKEDDRGDRRRGQAPEDGRGAPARIRRSRDPRSRHKTILFYNHYDVQPEEPLELWKSPPFQPEVRDGRIYGRGVSDDKGHLVARLKLIESYIKVNGEPPCNIKFCFEGEEEVGSPHLEKYVEENADLFKADAVMWEYGQIDAQGRPIVSLGVKGMIYLEMAVKTLNQDAHSMLAAALPNPVWRLVRLLSLIKDENERILIPGWYDKVKELDEDELEILRRHDAETETPALDLWRKGFRRADVGVSGEEGARRHAHRQHCRHMGRLHGTGQQDGPARRGPLQDGLQAGARPGPRRAVQESDRLSGREGLRRRPG